MIYYKAFKRDMTCRDFQYKEGETYEMDCKPAICGVGFHFCKALVLTLEYYPVDDSITENRYAEVEVLGDVDWDEPTKHKGCTNKIKIVRVLPDEEVESLVDGNSNSGYRNSGYRNSGYSNSGNSNSGNRNSGNSNSGNSNSGNSNSGHWNSGYSNSGNSNSGYRNSGNSNSGNSNSGNSNSGNSNSGHWNSGYRNSGYSNSGHWNSGNSNSGHFNTITPDAILVFNRPCLRSDWDSARKPSFLYFDPGDDYKAAFQKSFEKATAADIELLKALPNFDADVFFEISGIDLREEK